MLRRGLPDRFALFSDWCQFALRRGAEPLTSHLPSHMSGLSPELLQGFREPRAPTFPGAFLKCVLLAAFSVLFHPS